LDVGAHGRLWHGPGMRFVIYGAGAIGGVIGARLHQNGHDVALIARGEHARTMQRDGLVLESADEVVTLAVPAHAHPSEVDWRPDDVVVLAMKSQDTRAAVEALADLAPASIAVACAQNGVANERMALRCFADVYGVWVMCPATHLEPGAVQANAAPISGILDLGRYPAGVDDRCAAIATALASSTFVSVPRPDIMRWKYAKLLANLGNVVQAAFVPSEASARVAHLARVEARECLDRAGIDYASGEEDRARRGDHLQQRPIAGQTRGGGSTWQSLARGAPRLETDFLNGEIVLIGRLHGVPTPVNVALARLGHDLARQGAAPGAGVATSSTSSG
jgi:2-dehydropantoate 2-reductase